MGCFTLGLRSGWLREGFVRIDREGGHYPYWVQKRVPFSMISCDGEGGSGDSMKRSRTSQLVEKSVAAMVSAIEIYNKPDHKYREETFAILALNAWELLFKAKVLHENRNDLRSLYVYESRSLKDGSRSTRRFIRRNRAGNPMTIGLGKALGLIESEGYAKIDPALRANLNALGEIRDNAVHLMNTSADLSRALQELGAATLQNYVLLTSEWFAYDLSQYNFYLMPLAFFRDFETVRAIPLTTRESNLIKHLAQIHQQHDGEGASDRFSVMLELNVRLVRSALPTAARLAYGYDEESDTTITLSEEDIRELYPWDYRELTSRLRERYDGFKENKKYHDIRKSLLQDKRYAMRRYLDPDNPKSATKDFYSRQIVNEFDRHYIRA